jgi:hypothetical protein
MDKNSYENSLLKDSIIRIQDIVTHCLTSDCEDCLGAYSNDLLGHRFVCICDCHNQCRNKTPRPPKERQLGGVSLSPPNDRLNKFRVDQQ